MKNSVQKFLWKCDAAFSEWPKALQEGCRQQGKRNGGEKGHNGVWVRGCGTLNSGMGGVGYNYRMSAPEHRQPMFPERFVRLDTAPYPLCRPLGLTRPCFCTKGKSTHAHMCCYANFTPCKDVVQHNIWSTGSLQPITKVGVCLEVEGGLQTNNPCWKRPKHALRTT